MAATPCPYCIRVSDDLYKLETELEFLAEGMPLVARDPVEGPRVTAEFRRVEAALDVLEAEYDAHCNSAVQHRLENRAALN